MKLILAGFAVAVLAMACGGEDAPVTESPTPGTSAPQATPTATSEPAGTDPTATQEPPATPTTQPFQGGTDPVLVAPISNDAVALSDVRAATHDGFDRIVFEFEGAEAPGYKVQYAAGLAACGSGQPVALPGAATLSVEFTPSTAHNDDGESTADVSSIDLGGAAITTAKATCDFEAIVAWAVGVTGERPFSVFELSEPSRLVIDIAHP